MSVDTTIQQQHVPCIAVYTAHPADSPQRRFFADGGDRPRDRGDPPSGSSASRFFVSRSSAIRSDSFNPGAAARRNRMMHSDRRR